MAKKERVSQKADALREELNAARKNEKPSDQTGSTEERPSPEPEAATEAQSTAEDLQQVLKDLAESVESEVKERPLISVAVAFVLGLVIGRLISR